METLVQVAMVIWMLALTWVAVLVALEVRRYRRRAARLQIMRFPSDGPPLYWTTWMDAGDIESKVGEEEEGWRSTR